MLKYSHKTVSKLSFQALTIQYHFESEDDYRSGCPNVSHCNQQFFNFQNYTHPEDHTRQTSYILQLCSVRTGTVTSSFYFIFLMY